MEFDDVFLTEAELELLRVYADVDYIQEGVESSDISLEQMRLIQLGFLRSHITGLDGLGGSVADGHGITQKGLRFLLYMEKQDRDTRRRNRMTWAQVIFTAVVELLCVVIAAYLAANAHAFDWLRRSDASTNSVVSPKYHFIQSVSETPKPQLIFII